MRAVTDDNTQAGNVLISGATGHNADFINGLFSLEEIRSDGYALYSKDCSENICIEHFKGRWEIKPGSSLGKSRCFAYIAGLMPLEACTSRVWSVFHRDGGLFHAQPTIRMVTSTTPDANDVAAAEAKASAQGNSRPESRFAADAPPPQSPAQRQQQHWQPPPPTTNGDSRKLFTADGRPYYMNVNTGKGSWAPVSQALKPAAPSQPPAAAAETKVTAEAEAALDNALNTTMSHKELTEILSPQVLSVHVLLHFYCV